MYLSTPIIAHIKIKINLHHAILGGNCMYVFFSSPKDGLERQNYMMMSLIGVSEWNVTVTLDIMTMTMHVIEEYNIM